LHRSAYAYGGLEEPVSLSSSNNPGNLVFGSWECNTDMIRAENFVAQLTKRITPTGVNFKGTLTTANTYSGSVSQRGLQLQNSSETIPQWVFQKKYCKPIQSYTLVNFLIYLLGGRADASHGMTRTSRFILCIFTTDLHIAIQCFEYSPLSIT
jgi:hypothetical protein